MQPCWNEAKVRAQGTKSKVKSTRWSSRQRWDAKERSKRLLRDCERERTCAWLAASSTTRIYSHLSFFFCPLLPWCEDKRRMRRDAKQKRERRPIARGTVPQSSAQIMMRMPGKGQTNTSTKTPTISSLSRPLRSYFTCLVKDTFQVSFLSLFSPVKQIDNPKLQTSRDAHGAN